MYLVLSNNSHAEAKLTANITLTIPTRPVMSREGFNIFRENSACLIVPSLELFDTSASVAQIQAERKVCNGFFLPRQIVCCISNPDYSLAAIPFSKNRIPQCSKKMHMMWYPIAYGTCGQLCKYMYMIHA